jgi:MFS transporter, DHA3 family, macrolide efflux protein
MQAPTGPSTSTPNRNLFFLLQAQFVSQIGSQIYDLAMLLWLYAKTGSAAAMGTAMLISNLPEAVLAPLGGSIADRLGRSRVAILADVASGLAVALVTLALLSSLPIGAQVAALCAGNLLLGLAGACRVPAVTALLPSMVSPERLQRASAWQGLATTGGRIAGQACGGILFATLGVAWAFSINSASFFASALLMLGIRRPGQPPRLVPMDSSVLGQTWRGLRHVWHEPKLRRPLVGIGVFHFCLASLPVVLPFLLQARLSHGPDWLGILVASYTAGIMGGLALAGLLRGKGPRLRTVGLAAATAGGLFIVLGSSRTIAVAIPNLVAIGLAIGIIVVNLMTELQVRAPEDQRAVVMGAAHAVGGSGLPIGMAVVGLLLDGLRLAGMVPVNSTFAVLGTCGVLALAAALYLARTADA